MSARKAVLEDLPRLDAFLMRHADGSMFPLGNLRQHGVTVTDHPRSMDFWIAERNGDITGAVGVSREGYVFPQTPEPDPLLSGVLCQDIAGRRLLGLIGPLVQAHRWRFDIGLEAVPVQHIGDEPHYALDLAELVTPDVEDLQLIAVSDEHCELVTEWRSHYLQEVIGLERQAASEKAAQDVAGFLTMDSHRVLLRSGTPVSFTGFNSALNDIVQIGAVYTPPALRRQGLARAAVALHLGEARGRGVGRAVLFAASEKAARAYEAIGFQRIGDFSMIFFDGPQQVHPCPA